MELLFGYLAGLLTLINPCVLPVLPIVLAGAFQASRLGPVALAAGMSLSFVALGIGVTAFGRAIGLTEDVVAQAGAVMMVLFGAVMLVPQASAVFSTATAGMAAGADNRLDRLESGSVPGQFLGGILLGAVWSPCVGPTLGGAISLASQGQSLGWAGAIMVSFALGVSSVILGLGYGTRGLLQRNHAVMQRIAIGARPVMGMTFVAVGLGLYFKFHYVIEEWALDALPIWFQDLSIAF